MPGEHSSPRRLKAGCSHRIKPPWRHLHKPVGRTPWSKADAPVGLLAPCKMLTPLCRQRDGVPRGPGGAPHRFCGIWPGLAAPRLLLAEGAHWVETGGAAGGKVAGGG